MSTFTARDIIANGKSILSLLSLAAECGTMLAVEAQGCDAEDAVAALATLISAQSHGIQRSGRKTSIAPDRDSVLPRGARRPCWQTHFRFHALTYSTLNVDGRSASSGMPNHSGIVSLSKIR